MEFQSPFIKRVLYRQYPSSSPSRSLWRIPFLFPILSLYLLSSLVCLSLVFIISLASHKREGHAYRNGSTLMISIPTNQAEKPTLSNINLDIPIGSLVAVVGSSGEGKTSLISAMLGELPPIADTSVIIRGSVAYVPQVSWIFNATVRDNILFGSPLQPAHYEKAIEVTALEHDLEILPVYTKGVLVLMPGQDIPTFIAHLAPSPCHPERVFWPLHQHNPFSNSTSQPLGG